jgi:hypothetical protein
VSHGGRFSDGRGEAAATDYIVEHAEEFGVLKLDATQTVDPEDPQMRGYRVLWGLVLASAIVEYLVCPPSSRRFRQAKSWIFYGEASLANSFDNIALFLNEDPTRLRRMIVRRRDTLQSDAVAMMIGEMERFGSDP